MTAAISTYTDSNLAGARLYYDCFQAQASLIPVFTNCNNMLGKLANCHLTGCVLL